MESQIPQHEVDAVAAYVQAARELKQSAFFHEDYHRLSVTTAGGRLTKAEFPDPNVRDAMLVSFRRLWAEKEPSNYFKVVKILTRHVPHWRNLLNDYKSQYQSELTDYPFVGPVAKPDDLSPNEILDLWINARFFHSGKTGRVGRFTRDDFERYRNQIGEVPFEYLFLLAAWHAGLSYGNLLPFAQDLLEHWCRQGLMPAFRIDTLNARGEQTSPDGVTIRRETPGWSITTETPGDKIARLLRRGRFRAFRSFVGLLGVDNHRLAAAVASSASLDTLCHAMGFHVVKAGDVDLNHTDRRVFFCDDEATVRARGRNRVGTAARRGQQILTVNDAVPILAEQFGAFREAFMEGSDRKPN